MAQKLNQKTAATSIAPTDIMLIANPTTGAMKKATVGQISAVGSGWKSLTDAATIAVNMNDGAYQKVSISATRNISFSNLSDGAVLILKVKHTVGATIINLPNLLPSSYSWASGSGEITLVTGVYDYADGWNWDFINYGSAGPDVTAPLISSITAINATTIRVIFNENVTATNVGWSFNNGGAVTPSAVSGSGTNTLNFTVSGLAEGQTITASYNPATGNTMDAASNELATQTSIAVTNSITTSYDSATVALIAAIEGAGATLTSGEKSAYDAFIVGLKAGTIWAKTRAWYVLGTSLAKSKFSFRDPTVNILSAGGTITYASDGASGDGSSAYLTGLPDVPAQNSAALFVSQLTNTSGLAAGIGNNDIGGGAYVIPGDTLYAILNGSGSPASVSNSPSSVGRYGSSRTSSGGFKVFKNGSVVITAGSDTSVAPASTGMKFFAAGGYYSSAKLSCGGVFDGLSDAEMLELDGLVASLNTALGR